MDEHLFAALDKDERKLAKVLLKNKLITEENFLKYLEFKKVHDDKGKQFIGQVLLKLGYLNQSDLDTFIKEQQGPYLKFCGVLEEEGFLMKEHFEKIKELAEENGSDIVQLMHDLNIMTKDNFIKLFEKRAGGRLRLGDWLKMKGLIKSEQLDKAKKIQMVNNFTDYLTLHGMVKVEIINKIKDKLGIVY